MCCAIPTSSKAELNEIVTQLYQAENTASSTVFSRADWGERQRSGSGERRHREPKVLVPPDEGKAFAQLVPLEGSFKTSYFLSPVWRVRTPRSGINRSARTVRQRTVLIFVTHCANLDYNCCTFSSCLVLRWIGRWPCVILRTSAALQHLQKKASQPSPTRNCGRSGQCDP